MSAKVIAARREADAAKAVLTTDVQALRHKLTPSVIVDRTTARAATAVEAANGEIRARPGAAAAVLALLWMLAARHRLARRLRRPVSEAPYDSYLHPEFSTISRHYAGQEGIHP